VIAGASGKVAVVTGAETPAGAGLAAHFASAGLHLGLCARHRPALVARTRPTAHDGHVDRAEAPLCAAVDVTDREARERFAAEVVERFGRIDLWVNNAGLLGPVRPLAHLDAATAAAAARTIDVNVTGVLHGSAVFAAHVRTRPGPGVLVNVSSGAAVKPYEGWATYCASKAAVDQLTRVAELEEGRNGLRAYALSPGVVDTDMQAAVRAATVDDFPDVARFVRLKQEERFNTPSWVAEHILALAFGERPPPEEERVTVRVPDQPAAGVAG
jgi:NAD(P)-dependent dehydrogenase (short-subunit alcohol dehydrogenase family)